VRFTAALSWRSLTISAAPPPSPICPRAAAPPPSKARLFFASVPVGDVARAECTPLHRGRSTMVWQTRITRGDGRLCALVIQTQIVMAPEQS